jgi:mRNA-degrading endonuclease RelE of RelBE toxin-antitoxin system
MLYEIIWKNRAIKQARKLPVAMRKNVHSEVDRLRNRETWHNVKPLKNHQYDFRLRVGDYRILFNCEDEIKIIEVEEVKKRDERTY